MILAIGYLSNYESVHALAWLIRPLHVAGTDFRIQSKERIGPELITGFNTLFGKTVVSPLRSRRIIILKGGRLGFTGVLSP